MKRSIVEGREVGPVRAVCEVISRKRAGAYWSMTLASPEIASRSVLARPRVTSRS